VDRAGEPSEHAEHLVLLVGLPRRHVPSAPTGQPARAPALLIEALLVLVRPGAACRPRLRRGRRGAGAAVRPCEQDGLGWVVGTWLCMNARMTMQIRLLAMMSAAAGEITRSARTCSTMFI
jgi:hypothetical protein